VVEVVVVEVEVDVYVDIEELVEAEARLLVEVSSDVISAKDVSGRPVVESGSNSDGCVISRVVASAIGISSRVFFKIANVVPDMVLKL
jgi:hypothetical protein